MADKKDSDKKVIVTPWEVKGEGEIDYAKLIKDFGTSRIDDALLERIKKHAGDLHHFLRRGIFFSHRDLNLILDEYEKGNKFFLYTGRAPSGKIHLGHLVPWIFTKWLQDKFDVELYFQMSDEEKFLFKENLTLEETHKLAYENALDVIALGFDPKKTFIFSNLDYAKTMYPQAIKVSKKITFSTVKAVFGLKEENNIGQIFYTSMQTVPTFLPSILKKKNIPCLVPMGIDQDPHFRIARDVVPKLGYLKPAVIHSKFLPSLEGVNAKMSSSSDQNIIYTTDSPQEVRKKIQKYAFSGGKDTVDEHRKKGGNPEVDVSFQYLLYFEEDAERLQQIYQDYKAGRMLTSELKEILIEKLNKFLADHQEKRAKATKVLDKFILKD